MRGGNGPGQQVGTAPSTAVLSAACCYSFSSIVQALPTCSHCVTLDEPSSELSLP